MSSKKEMLLNVSEDLFYLHGFHAIGLKRIIMDAGIAIMTLYNHFKSKDELIVAVLLRREQRYWNSCDSMLAIRTNPSSLTLLKDMLDG